MAFYVGQKVVAIRDVNGDKRIGPEIGLPLPRRGQVFTVRRVIEWSETAHFPASTSLYLCEIVCPPVFHSRGFSERGFRALNFRPIVERKTDISIFTEMLDRTKVPV